jgi:DNA polymerase I-like protein with 3'-5' exonuclease and polymerase domains
VEELQDVIRVRNRRTFIELFLNKKFDWDGKMRFGFNPVGTVTGRSSASSCPFYTGLNPQQTPRSHGDPHRIWNDFRSILLADDGCSLVAGDLAQAEARDVTFLCNDMIEKGMYKEGKSVHIRNAMICSGLPEEECGKRGWAYDLGKMSKHQYNYMGGPILFHRRVIKDYGKAERPLPEGFSVKMVKDMFSRFDTHAPLVKQVYHVDVKHQIKRNRMLYNPFGRRRFMMEAYGDELFRSGYATIPQSTVVDIIHRAMKWENLPSDLPKDAYLILQVHDYLVVHCKDADIEEVKSVMKKWMEVGIMIHGDEMIIPVEFEVGKNFGEV